MAPLACRLEAEAAGGVVTLAVWVRNTGSDPVELEREEPFTGLALRAWVDGGETPVVIPPMSVQVRLEPLRLEPGEELPLATPVYLRFDPDALYGAGEDMFAWGIAGAPGPLELEAVITVGGVTTEPCRARVEP
jgi:hypothetical protein